MANQRQKRMLMLTDGNVDNASARIRAIQYIPFFEAHGFEVSHIPRVPLRPANVISKFTVFPILKRLYSLRMVLAILFGRWELVYIQRIFIGNYLIKHLKNRSEKIIYDFDDAIYINTGRPEDELKTARMVRLASKVIVSTDHLKKYCLDLGQDAEVIPSPVETDRIYPLVKQQDNIITIGWIGSPWTTGFLELVEKPIQKLAAKYQFRLLTIGAKPEYKITGVNHVSKSWVFEDENTELGAMDIGIMPLPDTDWTRMKGGYKLLQYFSAGIPCVASPVGINRTIVRTGENGYLATTDEEWYSWLELLINDPALRERLGINGRNDAVELYSREVCIEKLLSVIKLM
jgi:glycosyltransferase involved in cell wall biosynthesis